MLPEAVGPESLNMPECPLCPAIPLQEITDHNAREDLHSLRLLLLLSLAPPQFPEPDEGTSFTSTMKEQRGLFAAVSGYGLK